MNVVIDTSAIIAVVSNEPTKPMLIDRTEGVTLIAPQSVEWEIGNAFSAMLKRRRINVEQAITAIGMYKRLPIRFVKVELEATIKIADELNIYAYDAYLIRCAQKYESPLLALDRGLREAAKRFSVEVVEV